jgi:hypothetical protein
VSIHGLALCIFKVCVNNPETGMFASFSPQIDELQPIVWNQRSGAMEELYLPELDWVEPNAAVWNTSLEIAFVCSKSKRDESSSA